MGEIRKAEGIKVIRSRSLADANVNGEIKPGERRVERFARRHHAFRLRSTILKIRLVWSRAGPDQRSCRLALSDTNLRLKRRGVDIVGRVSSDRVKVPLNYFVLLAYLQAARRGGNLTALRSYYPLYYLPHAFRVCAAAAAATAADLNPFRRFDRARSRESP